ncbi:MAG: butyrate kinase [Eubacteriales bacterium]|nr:butyrate kinase [Eubacteriales bacterium]
MPWIFTINPGSTSTKTALFHDTTCVFESVVRHDHAALAALPTLQDQLPLRLAAIEQALDEAITQAQEQDWQPDPDLASYPPLTTPPASPADIDAFVGRGGLLRPLTSGTYSINPDMLADLTTNRYGTHASNLGALIAFSLATRHSSHTIEPVTTHHDASHVKPAFIVDPVTVDEFEPLARYTGLPQLTRLSRFHALNHKAIARRAADQLDRPYSELNLIIAHLGGGISIAAHRQGRVIDVNNALEEGPFSPERAGTLPTLQLLDLFESQQYTPAQIRTLLVGRGGLFAYTGTTDARAIEDAAHTDPQKRELLDAMAYQIAKSIGAMAIPLKGQIDAIILTGGLARSPILTRAITESTQFLGPMIIIPGEDEMLAMAEGALRVLVGQEAPKTYEREA